MPMKRESFVLYTKINEVVKELDDGQKGRLFQAILDYEETGEMPELDQLLRLVFIPIKQDLDKNNEKWESQSKARSEAGRKGMASRYNKDVTEPNKDITESNKDKSAETVITEPNKTNKDSKVITKSNKTNKANGVITEDNTVITNLTNVTDNVYVYDNVNDNDINTPPISPSNAGDGERADPIEIRFDEFWTLYPKKQGKGAALKAWKKIKPTNKLHAKIMASVQDNVNRNQQWQRDGGRYIPNPATWLNQTRWLDEIPDEQMGGAEDATGSSTRRNEQRIGGADDYHDFKRSTGFRNADSDPDTYT